MKEKYHHHHYIITDQSVLSFLRNKQNRCQSCMYQYSPKKGDDFYPVSAGTQFKDLPEDWNCPVCGASKSKFKSTGRQVAGFEQNQEWPLCRPAGRGTVLAHRPVLRGATGTGFTPLCHRDTPGRQRRYMVLRHDVRLRGADQGYEGETRRDARDAYLQPQPREF